VETSAAETLDQNQAVNSNKLSQKDAVFSFLIEALGGAVHNRNPGESLKTLVTKDIRKVVRQRLFQEIKAGNVKLGSPMDDSKLKKYCSGLINNWMKKDQRFN
jgi:hypothetical protein